MEGQEQHDGTGPCDPYGLYNGQDQTGPQSNTYMPLPNTAAPHFRTPQLPMHANPNFTTQPISQTSYLCTSQYAKSSFITQDPSFYQTDQMDLGGYSQQHQYPQQTSSIGLYEPSRYVYAFQQMAHDPLSQPYQSDAMRSMSMSSSSSNFDTPQTPSFYSPSYESLQHSQSSPTAGPSTTVVQSAYEQMPPPQHPFQARPIPKDVYPSHNSYKPPPSQQPCIQRDGDDLRESFQEYETRTKQIFTNVKNQQLALNLELLLNVSRYLIGNVEALGLDRDEKGQHENRLKLWDNFNRCWLTTLQMQFNMASLANSTGQSIPPSHSILDANSLEALGQELVKLCDKIEEKGLVDYQMGVAEDEIIEILIKCLDVLGPQSPATPKSNASGKRRVP